MPEKIWYNRSNGSLWTKEPLTKEKTRQRKPVWTRARDVGLTYFLKKNINDRGINNVERYH